MEKEHQATEFNKAHFPWEGAFVKEQLLNLRLSRGSNAANSYAFLSRQIQRSPNELAFHVCRIQCATRMKNAEVVYGAVLDLFVILDENGQALRRRMLDKARKHLPGDLISSLEKCVSGQLSSKDLPFSVCSVLHDGLSSNVINDLFLSAENNQSSVLDPLNTARMCLESGQIEQAQEILESQLEIEPERVEIRQDLLEIYCATRDQTSFMSSYQLLQIRGYVDESWEDAVNFFAKAS